jgi:predicted nucleotide-binding protein
MSHGPPTTLADLSRTGRNLINGHFRTVVDRHCEFVEWVDAVSEWLAQTNPDSGLCAEWSCLETSLLVQGEQYNASEEFLRHFIDVVRLRLEWLAKAPERLVGSQERSSDLRTRIKRNPQKVFLVHGHDEAAREKVARFLEQLKLQCIILHEQPNKGRTIIEKFVDHADVAFAVVLLTPDDKGGSCRARWEEQKLRPRQNVLLELGFFLGKLGRAHVCALYVDGVEIPSDYSGVLFIPLDPQNGWRLQLLQELKAAGMKVDANYAFKG